VLAAKAISWLWLVYALSLVWLVFICGAIRRAAGAYPGRRLWAILARLGVLVGILRMMLEAVLPAGRGGTPS